MAICKFSVGKLVFCLTRATKILASVVSKVTSRKYQSFQDLLILVLLKLKVIVKSITITLKTKLHYIRTVSNFIRTIFLQTKYPVFRVLSIPARKFVL